MGEHDAFLDLGKSYETGIGVAKNPRQAEHCYRRLLASEHVTESGREQATKRLSKLLKKQQRAS